MNLLFGMFLAGAAAVVFPFVFHLIRQTPKGKQEFSSLIFLDPTPPTLTRRSRLDDILLLILRGLVIVLLALAFTRPFWRAAADLSLSGVRGRRVAIVLDTSASMRRGNLWNQAIAQTEEVLGTLAAGDDVALFVFDRELKAVVNFDNPEEDKTADKPALVRSVLKEQSPSWNHTDLGAALIRVAEVLDEGIDREESDDALQIILISDMQSGAELESLKAYEWPDDVRVSLKPVALPEPSNASLQLMAADDEEAPDADPRVQVINSPESTLDQFSVSWTHDKNQVGDEAVSFYVPPGQTRVLPVQRSSLAKLANRLLLTGDAADFDNQHFVVPVEQEEFRLAYLGDDAPTDAEGLLYFLNQVLIETPDRKVVVTSYEAGKSPPMLAGELPHLVVIARKISEDEREKLQSFLNDGGQSLVVLRDQEMAKSLGELFAGAKVDSIETLTGTNYRLLGEIDFTHPLFQPFAGPRYNDFTGIKFWNYRSVTLPEKSTAHVLSRFDNGKPFLWEQPQQMGKIYVFSSSWAPQESSLSVSNKFLPLMEEIVSECTPRRLASTAYLVGDAVSLPELKTIQQRVMLLPDGTEFPIKQEDVSFTETHQPGIYTLKTSTGERRFAVNIPQGESQTAPMPVETLEQLHIQLGTQATQSEEYERLRQLRDRELENKQKLWKWLVLAAMIVVGMETWLAGKRAGRTQEVSGESA